MTAMNIFRCLLFASLYYHQTISQAQTQGVQGYDCSNIWNRNHEATSGIYRIKPINSDSDFLVFCEMSKNGGWTLIQRHNGLDGLSFIRTWQEYENGFGKLKGEHWLGLKNIHALTHQSGRPAKLHVDIGDFHGHKAYAEYSPFSIGNSDSKYKLSLGDYSGTAGNAFRGDKHNGTNQYGSMFSTWDVVNDNCHPECQHGDIMYLSCSHKLQAGWWFNSCGSANLNGIWQAPSRRKHSTSYLSWPTWRPYESLKFSKMYLIH